MIDAKRGRLGEPVKVGQRWRNQVTGQVWTVTTKRANGQWLIVRDVTTRRGVHHIHEGTLRKFFERA